MNTEGRTRSFLGFASGIAILIWLYLFAQTKLNIKLDFLGDRITDHINLIILFLAAGLFIFATWKRSKIFYLLSFVVLVAWLGNEVFNRIAERYPENLKIPVPSGVVELGNATNERLKIIAEQIKKPETAPPPPPPKQEEGKTSPAKSGKLAVGDIYASHHFSGGEVWNLEIIPGKYRVTYGTTRRAPEKEIGYSFLLDNGLYSKKYNPGEEMMTGQKQVIKVRSDIKQEIVFYWNGSL
jgi:hypothetical protein